MIPGVLGRSLNSNITYRFLCGRPVFPDYLSVSYDYDGTNEFILPRESFELQKFELHESYCNAFFSALKSSLRGQNWPVWIINVGCLLLKDA